MDQAAPADQGVFWRVRCAVKTQVWIAIAVCVLVAILKKRLESEASRYTILQILSLTLFEKTPLNQLVTNIAFNAEKPQMPNQLNLFEEISGQ